MSDKLKSIEVEVAKHTDETNMYVEDWELPDGDQYEPECWKGCDDPYCPYIH